MIKMSPRWKAGAIYSETTQMIGVGDSSDRQTLLQTMNMQLIVRSNGKATLNTLYNLRCMLISLEHCVGEAAGSR